MSRAFNYSNLWMKWYICFFFLFSLFFVFVVSFGSGYFSKSNIVQKRSRSKHKLIFLDVSIRRLVWRLLSYLSQAGEELCAFRYSVYPQQSSLRFEYPMFSFTLDVPCLPLHVKTYRSTKNAPFFCRSRLV